MKEGVGGLKMSRVIVQLHVINASAARAYYCAGTFYLMDTYYPVERIASSRKIKTNYTVRHTHFKKR